MKKRDISLLLFLLFLTILLIFNYAESLTLNSVVDSYFLGRNTVYFTIDNPRESSLYNELSSKFTIKQIISYDSGSKIMYLKGFNVDVDIIEGERISKSDEEKGRMFILQHASLSSLNKEVIIDNQQYLVKGIFDGNSKGFNQFTSLISLSHAKETKQMNAVELYDKEDVPKLLTYLNSQGIEKINTVHVTSIQIFSIFLHLGMMNIIIIMSIAMNFSVFIVLLLIECTYEIRECRLLVKLGVEIPKIIRRLFFVDLSHGVVILSFALITYYGLLSRFLDVPMDVVREVFLLLMILITLVLIKVCALYSVLRKQK